MTVERKKIDAGVATRFISASIPKSQRFPGRNLDSPPSTSAAALAARQAEEAVRERIGMSGRFRFVAEDSERVVVGQEDDVDDEEDQEEEEEQEEEIIGDELQHDGMELEEKNTDQVEAFMKDFEDEMQERETGDKSEAVLDEGEPKKKKSRTNKNKGKK